MCADKTTLRSLTGRGLGLEERRRREEKRREQKKKGEEEGNLGANVGSYSNEKALARALIK